MSRPPKAAEQHKYEGTFRSDRQPDGELQTHGRPLRPEYFADNPGYCEAWTNILRSAPWLTESDSETAEKLAVSLATWRDFVRNGVPKEDKEFYKWVTMGKQLDVLLSKCGLNPADRQRIRAGEKPKPTTKGRFFEN